MRASVPSFRWAPRFPSAIAIAPLLAPVCAKPASTLAAAAKGLPAAEELKPVASDASKRVGNIAIGVYLDKGAGPRREGNRGHRTDARRTQTSARSAGEASDPLCPRPAHGPANTSEIEDNEELATFKTEIAKNGAPSGVMTGTTAIARGRFGQGRVICFSPHPEMTAGLEMFVQDAIDCVNRAK